MLTTFFFLKRLTVPAVDQFIADLKDSVKEAKIAPSGNGTMVSLYGMLKGILFGFNSIFRRSWKVKCSWTRVSRGDSDSILGCSIQSVKVIG